jgi:hypothetical protein
MKKNNQDLRGVLSEANPEMAFLAGHDNAILGITEGYHKEAVVAYDIEIIIFNLMEEGMTEEGARKHYEAKIGNHTGEKNMPIFISSMGLRMVPQVFEIDLKELKGKKKSRGKKK